MQRTRTIEIDLSVHKKIELSRNDFSETDNQVLRRLLGLAADDGSLNGIAPGASAAGNGLLSSRKSQQSAWGHGGVNLPHGTQLRMSYNGQEFRGEIDNGRWVIHGHDRTFKSPSGAASGVARTREGKRASIDGWHYWQVKRPGDTEWRPLQSLRATRWSS